MLIFRRNPLPLFLGILWAVTSLVRAADAPAPAAPPVPAPAFVDVVSFDFDDNGEIHKAVVTSAPNLLRVDEVDEGYSILYNPQTDFYTGLEHRNYTYWQFSWPEVRAAVETSKRHEARLQELGNEGLNSDSLDASLNTNSASGSTAGTDDSGYVWHPTTDRKRLAGLDCIRWVGDTVSGESVEAWCYAGTLPKLQTAIDELRKINEPIALVPVRTVVPDFIFPVYSALLKGGVTPLLINWGDGQEKHHFRYIEARTNPGKLSLFTVPKLYTKTTLITMDGMIQEQPAPAPRTSTPAKTWQN
jgi:hypothetical protein